MTAEKVWWIFSSDFSKVWNQAVAAQVKLLYKTLEKDMLKQHPEAKVRKMMGIIIIEFQDTQDFMDSAAGKVFWAGVKMFKMFGVQIELKKKEGI